MQPIFTLAMGSLEWIEALAAVLGAAMVIWQVLMERRIQRFERMKEQISEQADELISLKMKEATSELKSEMKLIGENIKQINERLKFGENEFRQLSNEDRKVERSLTHEFHLFSKWVYEHCATKDELKSLADRIDRKAA